MAVIFAESLVSQQSWRPTELASNFINGGDKMKKRLIFVLTVFAVCGFSVPAADTCLTVPADVARAFEEAGLPVLRQKVPAFDFTVPLADFAIPSSGRQNLKTLEGKVVFLNFWATWCGPCRSEMPSMEILYRRFKSRGLAILAVNYQEGQKDVAAFMKNYKLSFPAGLDSSGRVGNNYGIEAFPTTYIIDRDGYIITRVVGSLNWNTPKMLAAFEVLLNSPR
jgi:thiol-disulfide isomerase/thioredoxin